MIEFQVRLALEWLQARATKERTAAVLEAIVEHGAQAHCLNAEQQRHVYTEALAQAQRRGLLAQEA